MIFGYGYVFLVSISLLKLEQSNPVTLNDCLIWPCWPDFCIDDVNQSITCLEKKIKNLYNKCTIVFYLLLVLSI